MQKENDLTKIKLKKDRLSDSPDLRNGLSMIKRNVINYTRKQIYS